MGNERHEMLIRQGAAILAKWREKNPTEVLDLSHTRFMRTEFAGYDLRLVDWTWANLTRANLSRCVCSGSVFRRTNLADAILEGTQAGAALFKGANLTGANLRNADLRGADLSQTNLIKADLSGADCRGAVFNDAVCEYARFDGANLEGASMTNANLQGATGLSLP